MGILQGIFKARDKPKDSLGGSRYSFFFGSTTAGKPVNEHTAMQMTAVYSCVRILSETLAGLPLHVYKYNDNGGKEKYLTHPIYKLLHDEPNPEMTSFAFRETLPLTDIFEVHADNRPGFDVQEVRISLFSKGNYQQRKRQIITALLNADITVTERRYIGHEDDTGYHHYAIDCGKCYSVTPNYGLEE